MSPGLNGPSMCENDVEEAASFGAPSAAGRCQPACAHHATHFHVSGMWWPREWSRSRHFLLKVWSSPCPTVVSGTSGLYSSPCPVAFSGSSVHACNFITKICASLPNQVAGFMCMWSVDQIAWLITSIWPHRCLRDVSHRLRASLKMDKTGVIIGGEGGARGHWGWNSADWRRQQVMNIWLQTTPIQVQLWCGGTD